MTPTAASAAARSAFRLVSKCRCNGLIDVFRYRSERTGLRLTIADVIGPNVSGFFCLATETDSDDGLPHTLEHLIFMGSEKYPYKGVLDLVANRCLASGTNAWTDTDHTCYTLTTAGSEGFITMLPIYLDHIFHPLLTDAQYTTEVHHINGQGEDAGVVYCEMQEMESQMNALVDWKFKELMFPEGCGYRAETGGRLPNLRTSTSNKKVRAYHAGYYHPRNCEVIITGQIEHEKVFEALKDVENRVVEKKLSEKAFNRPWTSSIPPLNVNEVGGSAVKEETVVCPSDDGESGEVAIGWRGPLVQDFYSVMAIDILLDYLSDTAVSPLERDFIQIVDPYCAAISVSVEEYSETVIRIDFAGVKAGKLRQIRPRLVQILKRIADGEELFDTARMDDLLRKASLKVEDCMETSPHRTISTVVIGDFLYANSDAETATRFDHVAMYKKMRGESREFWIGLVREYLSERKPHICVIGEPNQEAVKKLTEAERARIQEQKERLGEEGLQAREEILNMAMEENELRTSNPVKTGEVTGSCCEFQGSRTKFGLSQRYEPPAELLERCIVDTLDGIKFFNLHSSTNRTLDEDGNSNFPLSSLPCTAILNDCSGTRFIEVGVQMDTSRVSSYLKPLLFLWSSLLFESPILRGGEVVPYEKVVAELNRDLVSYEVGAGIKSASTCTFLRIMSLDLKVDFERFTNAIEWTRQLVCDTQFPADRIRVVAQRLINMAADYKRDGYTVAQFLNDYLIYEPQSQPLLQNLILQEKYLKTLLERLDKDPDKVVSELKQLRDEITAPDRLILNVLCETDKFKKAGLKLEEAFMNSLLPQRLKADDKGLRAKLSGNEPTYVKTTEIFNRGIIASVGSCESCYVFHNTPCPLKYQDADLPALQVLLQYLDQLEGPLWREIRGRGLAYGVNLSLNVDLGLLVFSLYRTSDPIVAYKESKGVIERHLCSAENFDEDEFDAAKRSLIFDVVAKESTIKKASTQALLSYYRGVPTDYNRQLLQRIWNVKMEELAVVGQKYLPGLFDLQASNTAISCHPSKLKEVVDRFRELGRDLKIVTLEDEELYKY